MTQIWSVGYEVLTAVVMKCAIFWNITPCSPLKVNGRFRGKFHLNLQGRNQRESRRQAELCLSPAFTPVSCSAYFSTLKMEVICSSGTSVEFQRTARRYIPEGNALEIRSLNRTVLLFSFEDIMFLQRDLPIHYFDCFQINIFPSPDRKTPSCTRL
jgi:hypothetical protein